MQNFEKAAPSSIAKHLKSATHYGKNTEQRTEELQADELIDCEVPGDSYYTQYGDTEQDMQKLFSKE